MVKLNKIYTRTGDDGTTGLIGSKRVRKSTLRIELIGCIDEANASVGVCRFYTQVEQEKKMDRTLLHIQHHLFDLGADMAQEASSCESETVLRIVEAQVLWVEQQIDMMNKVLVSLTSFVLPGGTPLSAHLHVARTIMRRAERMAVALSQAAHVNVRALAYMNRLSDYLFVLARYANSQGSQDVLWVPGKNRTS